ncbi:MAG: protein kinase [Archangium sp.]
MVGVLVALSVLCASGELEPTVLDGGLLRYELPESLPAADDLALSLADERMHRAWVDGVEGTLDPRFPQIIPLPPSAREVTVELGPWPDQYVGDPAHLGSARALIAQSLATERTQAVVGFLLTLVGTLVLAAALAWRRQSTTLLGLGLFALATGLISIGQATPWYPLIWPNAHAWYLLRMITPYVYSAGFAVMAIGLFGDTTRQWLRKLALAEFGWLVISLGLFASGLVRFRVLRRGAYVLLLAIIVLTIVHLWKRRRTDPVARTFFFSFMLLIAFGIPDIMWGMGLPLVSTHLAPLGLLAFVAGGAFMVAERAAEQRQAAERALTDVNALNVELRHQLEQRSRDLKEHFAAEAGVSSGLGEDLQVGAQLDGRYVVRAKLGAGAMGAVYAVSRVSDGKRFAVKMLTGKVTGVEAARFAQEAEIAARLSHPNLVGIVDVGRVSTGLVYLVLELVEGRTLEAARPEFGKFTSTRRVLHGLAAGLTELHRAGFVHRDLKPGNVLLARDAEGELARITDFGVARTVDEAALATRLKLTTTGAWVGTPIYMAPEMMAGRSSPRSDVFALAIIAFELSCGRYPFVEPPIIALLSGRTPPPIDWGDAQLEPAARRLIEAGLSADPAARPDAAAFASW